MSKDDELKQRVRESASLIDRLLSCRQRIGKMCSEHRTPRMTIPVQWDDDDFFMGVTLQDAVELLIAVENQLTRGCEGNSTSRRG